MKQILIIHLGDEHETERVNFLNEEIQIQLAGCGGHPEIAKSLIAEFDGKVDAIGLDGLPATLELGSYRKPHKVGQQLKEIATETAVVDGQGIRAGLERWGIILADRAQPGIFAQKHVFMLPGLNHPGLAQSLSQRTPHLRYADPAIYFGLPQLPGIGSKQSVNHVASNTLDRLDDASFTKLKPDAEPSDSIYAGNSFSWADILAGDINTIRRFAPKNLKRKTVVVESATLQDVNDLRERGVSILITLMPSTDGEDSLGRWSAAVIEAMLVALRKDPEAPLTEDTYLDLLAEIEWTPGLQYLQPTEAGINRFAFVIHPLNIGFIHKHKAFRWTRYFPDKLVESVAAYMWPLYISRITGGQSPTTGQKIEGHLYSLAATPREMMRHGERFTYDRLNMAARMAERRGARIMGLGAFTSVVGDAGITVAHESDIAITSGNSLTVSATLEAAKQAVIKMGVTDLTKGKVMIIGATGSIGAICSRLLAQAIFDVVLVSIEPERLIDLKRTIQAETPGAKVSIATKADGLLGECDLIVTATSAFGQRIVDVSQCKPGAVVCDVARPPDINKAEADLRPDVLVIESGEVLIPGDIDFGYDIGLPPKTAYACLAETALLAMEGRFEDYTLGRNITIERVKEIYRLFKKHQFQIAGLRSFDEYVTDEFVTQKRIIADQYRQDRALFARVQAEAQTKIASMPVMAKGVQTSKQSNKTVALAGAVAALGLLGLLFSRRKM